MPLKPKDIPQRPNQTYAGKGWASWGDWLGTGFVCYAERKWRPFRMARAFARSLKLKGQVEWTAYVQGAYKNKPPLPTDIPKSPNVAYKKRGWIRFGDWLGTGFIATREREYWPFAKARRYIRSLKIRSEADWRSRKKIPIGHKGCIPTEIPRNPEKVYLKAGYLGRGDWFGTGRTADHLRKYRSFKAARAYARGLGLRDQIEWIQFAQKRRANGKKYLPEDIPSSPHNTYKNKGWKNLRDWLGTPKPSHKRIFLPFVKARSFVRKLKLRSVSEWNTYSAKGIRGKPQRPKNIPSLPNSVYWGKGWRGWLDFLGKKERFIR